MKLHLPLCLFKSVLAALFIGGLSIGSGSVFAEVQDLIFRGSSLVWSTADELLYVNANGNSVNFAQGDNLSFTGASSVLLGEDISVGVWNIASGADVTLTTDGYELDVERIVLSGTLDAGDSLCVDSGSTLSIGNRGAVLESSLVLEKGAALDVDFSETGAATSLNNGLLTLQGGTLLSLMSAGSGNGREYVLFTNVSGLLDKDGNAITLDSSNNAASLYFDAERPGTGFWKNATLQLTDDGTLQLVRYTDISIPTGYDRTVVMDEPSDFTRYAGLTQDVAFRLSADVAFDASAAVMTNLASSRYFTSNSVDALAAIAFRNSENRMFYVKENETLIMKALRAVTFEDMAVSADEAISGGAIYVSDNSGITLEDNGSVIFSGTTLTANGAKAYGGALYAGILSPVVLNGNGSVEFLGNSAVGASAYGGAIYSKNKITLSDNGSVTFSENTASSSSGYACGGAIYGSTTLSGNGRVEFSGNTASSSSSYAYGGAIDGSATLSGNGRVEFSGNTASSSSSSSSGYTYANGGAISGDATLSDNGSVTFSENTASSSSGYARGGAIDGSTTLSGNGRVEFSGNTASSSRSAYGGAIYGSKITLSDNGSVTFSENTASSSYYSAYGGAISGTITLSGNGSVTFSGNTASTSSSGYSSAHGGAISGTITLSGNGSVTFSGNTASSSSGYASAYGGAIYGDDGTITLSGNGSVTFSGNTASSSSGYAYGGAIYSYGSITIDGNDNVTFARNVEKIGSTYRLRSLYLTDDSSKNKLTLSAGKGQSISFYDSVYMGANGSVELNADYEDADGVAQKASGTILFSGATTEDDLKKAKNGVAGTEEEILNSRTSELNCAASLYGGTLQVQDKAVLNLNGGLTVTESGTATMQVQKGATLNLSAMTIAENAQSSIEVSGGSAMTSSGQVSVAEGGLASLKVQESEVNWNGSLTIAAGSTATMQIQEGSAFNLSAMTIAENAQARVEVTGGSVMTASGQVSVAAGGTAALQVQKSELNLNGGLTIAAGSTATMQIQDGAAFNLSDMTIAENAQARVEVTGGSVMTASGQVSVAAGGLTSLKVQDSKVNWEKSSLVLSAGNRIELQDNAEFNLSDMTIAENAQATLEVTGGSVMTASGQVSVAAGGLASLKVQESEVNLGSNALALTSGSLVELQDGASLSLSELTVAAGAELKAGGYIAPVAEAAKPVAFSLDSIESDTPIVNTGSVNHVEGNLRLSGGSTLNLQDSYLTVSGDLVLDVTAESEKVVVELTPGIAKDELSQVVLFEVAGAVTFGENGTASDSNVVYYQFAEDYFTGDWISQDTWLVYDRNTNLVYLEGVNIIASVPEPTSSMLGLMGLVAFTLRRRRK